MRVLRFKGARLQLGRITKHGSGSGYRFGDAKSGRRPIALLGIALPALVFFLWMSVFPAATQAQESSPAQPSQQTAPEARKDNAPDHKSFGGELAEQTREATGADEEENVKLKHAASVQWLARKTGLSVHQAHLVALFLNFAVVVVIIFWAARKFLPAMFRNRSLAIQKALEEARAASQDANRRLAEIENRLRRLDVEIGQMQAAAEKEAAAEEVRIQNSADEEIRKVVQAAEQEIATAAKQARRDLSTHTASLAIALARKQINVDPNTDQVLVRSFASKLVAQNNNDHDGGKGGQ
jgi:F-type H+-transporting ATPase subunit b